MDRADGMNYAPQGRINRVCQPGEFRFAAVGLDHGHINGMCSGLVEAGAELVKVFDPDESKAAALAQRYPEAEVVSSEEAVLADETIQLVAGAAVPSERCALGLRVMASGKDYFTDKAPFTTLQQLEQAKQAVKETGRKYAVYYSERLHSEAGIFAGGLIQDGAIGRVVQVLGLGPHRLNASSRPAWFFRRECVGGILTDIGSHQVEQFLFYTGAKDARVVDAKTANYHSKEYPEFEDFGDASLVADNGAVNYFRVDWFTPDGLPTWGDGRTLILGTDGYIELRKYLDLAHDPQGDHVFLVNQQGTEHFAVHGTVGYPFFGELILDCLNRTEKAMTQAHAFKAAELSLQAQEKAVHIE